MEDDEPHEEAYLHPNIVKHSSRICLDYAWGLSFDGSAARAPHYICLRQLMPLNRMPTRLLLPMVGLHAAQQFMLKWYALLRPV